MNKVFAVYVGKDVDTVWATSKAAESRAAELAHAGTVNEVRAWDVNGEVMAHAGTSGKSVPLDQGRGKGLHPDPAMGTIFTTPPDEPTA